MAPVRYVSHLTFQWEKLPLFAGEVVIFASRTTTRTRDYVPPWSRLLLKGLTFVQLAKNIPGYEGSSSC